MKGGEIMKRTIMTTIVYFKENSYGVDKILIPKEFKDFIGVVKYVVKNYPEYFGIMQYFDYVRNVICSFKISNDELLNNPEFKKYITQEE